MCAISEKFVHQLPCFLIFTFSTNKNAEFLKVLTVDLLLIRHLYAGKPGESINCNFEILNINYLCPRTFFLLSISTAHPKKKKKSFAFLSCAGVQQRLVFDFHNY